jgi:hypothetical protein
MSGYKNFTKEFPKRCSELLKAYHVARIADREVTLMLSAASAGLTFPIERLKKRNQPYPFHDRANYPKVQREFDKFLSSSFLNSPLANSSENWRYGLLANVNGDADAWQELHNPSPLSDDKTVKDITSHIRNALAHGSIHTNGDPIDELIFVASEKQGSPNFYYLTVKANEFLFFFEKMVCFFRDNGFFAVINAPNKACT